MESVKNNRLYIAVNYGERIFVKAPTEKSAKERLKRRLLKQFGKYNITDLKEAKQ